MNSLKYNRLPPDFNCFKQLNTYKNFTNNQPIDKINDNFVSTCYEVGVGFVLVNAYKINGQYYITFFDKGYGNDNTVFTHVHYYFDENLNLLLTKIDFHDKTYTITDENKVEQYGFIELSTIDIDNMFNISKDILADFISKSEKVL